MNCERCNACSEGYELFDYCEACSRNLCETCMAAGRCRESETGKHVAANHGGDDEAGQGGGGSP